MAIILFSLSTVLFVYESICDHMDFFYTLKYESVGLKLSWSIWFKVDQIPPVLKA